MATIEDVISELQEHYALGRTPDQEQRYRAFLQRQQRKHKYDLNCRPRRRGRLVQRSPYFDLLVDSALLFSYLMGEREVRDDYGKLSFIATREEIKCLKVASSVERDSGISQIYNRRDKASRDFRLPSYVDLFNEIGSDQAVRKKRGEAINYAKHCRGK